MKKVILSVEGMHCESCEKRIQNCLSQIEGVKEVIANHNDKTVEVALDRDMDIKVITETIEDIGFEVKEN